MPKPFYDTFRHSKLHRLTKRAKFALGFWLTQTRSRAGKCAIKIPLRRTQWIRKKKPCVVAVKNKKRILSPARVRGLSSFSSLHSEDVSIYLLLSLLRSGPNCHTTHVHQILPVRRLQCMNEKMCSRRKENIEFKKTAARNLKRAVCI